MQIVIKLEQKDFDGNRAVFDTMYSLSAVINRNGNEDKPVTKASVEQAAHIEREREPQPIQEDKSEDTADDQHDTGTYAVEDLRKALSDLSKSAGREQAKAILTDLGYSKVTDIPPEKYAEAMHKIKEVMQ